MIKTMSTPDHKFSSCWSSLFLYVVPRRCATALLLLSLIFSSLISTSNGNLCALCQSLRDHVPNEFDSCLLRNFVIKHCDQILDVHLSSLKVVGVKRVIRVNYDGERVFWEIGVQVVQDINAAGEAIHHHIAQPPPPPPQPSPQNSTSTSTSNHHYTPTPPSSPHSVQLAVIRFNRYPSSLLLVNPCRHVLGTINNSFFVGKRKQFHNRIPTNTQRISGLSSGYFVIDDKLCHTQQRNGFSARKRCTSTPQNSSTHPYECCVPLPMSAPQHALPSQIQAPQCPATNSSNTGNSSKDPDSNQEYLRPLLLSVQCIAICFTLIISCVVFWIRKSKVIQVSVWPLTESIILGSTLLYGAVAIRASYRFDMVDHDSDEFWWEKEQDTDQSKYWACVAEPWARELGFTLVYGGIVLKIYRSLVEFRTRKAHRWVVREKDILRYLGTSVAVVLVYVLSWSVTVEFGGVDGGLGGVVCPAITNWHRVTEIGELVYVTVGLNMAWHLRTSPVSPFLERQMYTAALVLEASASVLLIIIRECKLMFFDRDADEGIEERLLDNHDNGAFLLCLYFVRCHFTTTVILGLVLGPKLYYVYVDATTRKRAGQLRRGDTLTATGTSGTGGGGGGGGSSVGGAGTGGGPPTSASMSNLTTLKIPPHSVGGVDHHTLIDLDFAEVSLAEMDPQDIKMELKRVYTQLELLRNKTMRKDNPHISKRRGGRKPTHRRFSLQKKGSRDKTAAAAAAMRSRMAAQAERGGGGDGENRGYGNNRYSGGSRYQDDIEDSVCSIEGPSGVYSEYR